MDFDTGRQRRICRRDAVAGEAVAVSEGRKTRQDADAELLARVRAAARQEQFLEVISADEARMRFERHLDITPLPGESVPLTRALTRVLAHDVVAAVDAPPFDRSNVDGFALHAADTVGAGDTAPKIFRLNAEVIACGDSPKLTVERGTATAIATGGVMPRGADAVVMIEHTELTSDGAPSLELRRAAAPGQFVSYAGSDIARGETLLRRGTRVGSREIAMLAAQVGGRLRQQQRDHSGGDQRSRRRTAFFWHLSG